MLTHVLFHSAEKFDDYRIVFTESIKEQVIAIGKSLVQVMSHVLCFLAFRLTFPGVLKPPKAIETGCGRVGNLVLLPASSPATDG